MSVNLKDVVVGDVLTYWYDAGIEYQIQFVRITKIGKKKIKIVPEGHGDREVWKYPHHFNRILSVKDVAELRADSVKI